MIHHVHPGRYDRLRAVTAAKRSAPAPLQPPDQGLLARVPTAALVRRAAMVTADLQRRPVDLINRPDDRRPIELGHVRAELIRRQARGGHGVEH